MSVKLPQETLDHYPMVLLFFARPMLLGDERGINRSYMICSNGINMVCATEDREPFLVPLRDVVKVSPRSGDTLVARVDSVSGCVLVTDTRTQETRSLGPVRGQPDPNINLMSVVAELGIELSKLPRACDVAKANMPHREVVTAEEMAAPIEQRSYEELINDPESEDGGLESLDDLPVPDLSDFEVEDETPEKIDPAEREGSIEAD